MAARETKGRRVEIPSYPGTLDVHPPLRYPAYLSTALRAPKRPLIAQPQRLTEVTAPVFGDDTLGVHDHDLTRGSSADPLGQRIIVHGRVLDSTGRPVPRTLVEIWQANAAGRYRHAADTWRAPIDPHFTGAGRTLTDDEGRYRFVTVKPGAYPWLNHDNAWRPAHIHFSLFGRAFVQRLVTQMYFPDDPLFDQDPIFNAVRDPRARARMVSSFDLEATEPGWALAFRFDIVVRGAAANPFEDADDD